MSPSRLTAVAVLAAMLIACNGDATQEGAATGQVLEGSISDEMLPVDRVRSEAPLADPTAARAVAAGGNEDGARESQAPAAADAELGEEATAEAAEAEPE